MSETLRSGAEAPKDILTGIAFTRKEKPDGSVEYRSSDPSRKLVVIEGGVGIEPQEGTAYTVEVVNDTDPSRPDKGKLVVRIVPESGEAPIAEAPKAKKRDFVHSIEIDAEGGKVLVLDIELPLKKERGPLVPRREKFRYFTLDEQTLATIEKAAMAARRREPCMFEGETSTSKTSGIEYLAMATGNEVARFNLNGQTDTSELIGKFVPNDGQLQIQFEDLLRHRDSLSEASRTTVTAANKEGRGLSMLESQKIAQAEGLKVPEWRWQDGIDVQAKKKGQWLILDEINLAEPQILERLNSELEKSPSLTLSENGGLIVKELDEEEMALWRSGKLPGIEPLSPNFRIFSTKNPAEYQGRQPMSPAYRDRWTSYKFVQPPTEKSYAEMMKLMVSGKQPNIVVRGKRYPGEKVEPLFENLKEVPRIENLIAKLAKLQVTLEDLARRGEIGKGRKEKYIFTRRGLIEFMEFIDTQTFMDRATGKKRSIKDASKEVILRAIQYYFLDKLSHPDDIAKVKDQLNVIGISESRWLLQ